MTVYNVVAISWQQAQRMRGLRRDRAGVKGSAKVVPPYQSFHWSRK